MFENQFCTENVKIRELLKVGKTPMLEINVEDIYCFCLNEVFSVALCLALFHFCSNWVEEGN